MEERKKCNRCKMNMTLDKFKMKRDDTYQVNCIECNLKKVAENHKYKCPHNRAKTRCKDCGGGSICQHNRQKNACKDCGGSGLCEHNRRRSSCKECGGSCICEHNRVRSRCKECGGGSICEHNRQRSQCKECGGGGICEHNRERNKCKECGGSSICQHNRQRSFCKECGGSGICEHNRERNKCKECGGSSICQHNRQRNKCKDCDPQGHLASIVSAMVRRALKQEKKEKSLEYLGCTIDDFKSHISEQFQEGMNWENHGEWHIDHITPLKYQNPTFEETVERLHYKNTQPMWANENIAKGNRFIGRSTPKQAEAEIGGTELSVDCATPIFE